MGAAVLTFTALPGVGSGAASGVATADTLPPPCLPETFPPGGSPRSGPFRPYEIPFSATLAGGYLEINSPTSLVTVILGGPINAVTGTGSITASSCGLLALPSQSGAIAGNPYGTADNNNADQYNNNFVFNNPIDISIGLKGVPGVPLLQGVGSADGELQASIDPTPAANGGLNAEFLSSAKSTSVLTLCALSGITGLFAHLPPPNCKIAPVPVQGGTCTVPIGDLRKAGIHSNDFGTVTKLAGAANTTPVHLSTRFTTADGKHGQPVTGPITAGTATLVANDFPVAAVDPNTPPSPFSHGLYDAKATPNSLCTQANANLFNSLLGLPSPAGANTFYAPGTFAIHTNQ